MKIGLTLSILLVLLSLILLFFSLVSDPYTSWGIEQEHVRPSVARISIRFGISSVFVSIIVAWLCWFEMKERKKIISISIFVLSIVIVIASVTRVLWVHSVIS